MHDGQGHPLEVSEPIRETARLLKEGWIVAIKGLGGFHLAVDAAQEEAVQRLRTRKHREEKPLAMMSRDLSTISRFARISEEEKEILLSKERPIVLLGQEASQSYRPCGGSGQSILRGHAALYPASSPSNGA